LDHILKMRVRIQKLNQQCRPGSDQLLSITGDPFNENTRLLGRGWL
jgi:hypothetical protein